MFLHKASQFNPAVPEDLVQLIVRKNRNGAIGDIDMQWDGETTTFRECVPGEQPAGPKERRAPNYNRAAEKESDGEDADFADEEPETTKGSCPSRKRRKKTRRPLIPIPIPIPTTPRTTRMTRAKATTRRKSLPTRNTRMSIPTRDTNTTFPAGATMRRPATPRRERRAAGRRVRGRPRRRVRRGQRGRRPAVLTARTNATNQIKRARSAPFFTALRCRLRCIFASSSSPSFPPRTHAVFRNLTA